MPEDRLLHSFVDFVRTSRLIENGEKIVVAVSGGIDSTVLLDCLDRLRERLSIRLAVAHFNHQLRGTESDEDEAFVRTLADKRNLPFEVDRADVRKIAHERKLSIEDAGRELRYEFFARLRTSLGFDKIATAHHADDSAETILHNLFRGAGVRGLSGIPAFRTDLNVVRPLLFATRHEISTYAIERKLQYREDSTNAKTDLTRNFIRHELIPLIQARVNPNLQATLRRTGFLFDQLDRYLQEEADQILAEITLTTMPHEVTIDREKFIAKPIFLQEYILRVVAKRFTHEEVDFDTVREMMKICDAESGSSCSIANGARFYRDRGNLIIANNDDHTTYSHAIELNNAYDFGEFTFSSEHVHMAAMSTDPNVEFVDAATLQQQLVLRSWEEGDWFIPIGMHDRKKLSDFFIDQRIPLREKRAIPILVSGNEIVWVVGRRLDERHKLTAQTEKIIKLEYQPRKHR